MNKRSKGQLGNKNGIGNKSFTGKKHTEETKKKMSEALKRVWTRKDFKEKHSGENNACWKGGISDINNVIRNSKEYKLWRSAVYQRDNYTCVWCGNPDSGNLNAHHIKPFALFPELRFAIDNGITLCKNCHKNAHK